MSYFWIQVKEDVVLEAEQQLVLVLDVLLHQGARRVQPAVNHSDIQHTESTSDTDGFVMRAVKQSAGRAFVGTLNC